MPINERPNIIENGPQNILRGCKKLAGPNGLSVGSEFLVEAVNVYDQPEAAECPMAEFIRRDAEVAVIDVDEPPKNIDEKSMSAAYLVRFAAGEEIFVSLRISGDPAKAGDLQAIVTFNRNRNFLIFAD